MKELKNFSKDLLERFVSYAKISTTSDSSSNDCPSTYGQRILLDKLKKELVDVGIPEVHITEHGYLFGEIPATDLSIKSIALFAHVDTSELVPKGEVTPIIHKKYNGRDIKLKEGVIVSSDSSLYNHKGETIITSDGTTLLGSDDKSGIAEIMTFVDYIIKNPELEHGDITIVFTPDEETGHGMDLFPWDKFNPDFCFTIDGGGEGEVELDCYNAAKAEITFIGKAVHPGYGRGVYTNALTMAAKFINLLPQDESPEATDGLYGNVWADKLTGSPAESKLVVNIRDFDDLSFAKRKKAIYTFSDAILASFPRGEIAIKMTDQYSNMAKCLNKYPELKVGLFNAVKECGIEPISKPIRGGTDGAILCSLGYPTPNIFTGGHNFHSREEWISLSSMNKAVNVLINLLDQDFLKN